jgi:hypothetical protein
MEGEEPGAPIVLEAGKTYELILMDGYEFEAEGLVKFYAPPPQNLHNLSTALSQPLSTLAPRKEMAMNTNAKKNLLILSVAVLLVGGFVTWAQMGPGGGFGQGPLSGFGCPMMGGAWGGFYPGFIAQNFDQAAQAAQQYLAATWRNPDLAVREVMEFSNHFYVQIVEESTAIGAMELLVDRITGTVHPEPGPNMMWNTKYGHHGGWGGPGAQASTAQMAVTREQALELAQQFLDVYLPGTEASDVTPFYGYYTLHVERGGQIVGMLSVNGFTGQIWYHSWHGAFLGMKEF